VNKSVGMMITIWISLMLVHFGEV